MRNKRIPQQQGLSKLEFAVVVAVVAVLAAVLLTSLADVQGEAERAEVDQTVTNIRAGIRMAVNEHMVRGQADSLDKILNSNPIKFLGTDPRGYVGETAVTGAPGSWRFDPSARILVYRARQPEMFDGQAELRWRMTSQGGGGIASVQLENAP